jgi:hypothetical protein
VGLIDGEIVIDMDGTEKRFKKQAAALVAPVIELDEQAIDEALDGVFDMDGDEEGEDFIPEDEEE